MDSLNLRSLIEVVRTGSFSKAAENLFVTQSAISRRIKCVEEECGHPLLDRSGPTIKPTAAGKIFIGEAEKILSLEENMLHRLDTLEHNPPIAFACTHPFGIAYLPDVLKRYTAKFPNLKNLKIAFKPPHLALDGLREGIFDFIVIEHWELLDLSGYATFPLPEGEMVFVSAPKLGLPPGTVTIDQLVKQRLYRRREDCCSWKHLAVSMQVAGHDVSEFTDTVTYDDLHVIVQSIVDGEGIALICRELVQAQIEAGVLCEHKVEGLDHRRKRTLVMNRQTVLTPGMKFLIASIFSSFGIEVPEL
ncbi:LysR family transcriptional regulator [Geomonas sp. Red32]|uniref:LysR family transcriptional regulator n=1 Tax=Geomonas sp. Red32 TaxID=2912856 RepID=UPI002545EE34|nr:LysR family transcriptional regulator [Geomonas sp. Red32]